MTRQALIVDGPLLILRSRVFRVQSGAYLALHNLNVVNGRVSDAPGEEKYNGADVVGAGILVSGATIYMESVNVASCTSVGADASTRLVGGGGLMIGAGSIAILNSCNLNNCSCQADLSPGYAWGGAIFTGDFVAGGASGTLIGCVVSRCFVSGTRYTVRMPNPTHVPARERACPHEGQPGSSGCQVLVG